MMDINSLMPESGRILDENGNVVNIVDLLNPAAAPVSGAVHDINAYSPRSGRVIGEDGKLYNLVDLLANAGNGGTGGGCDCEPQEPQPPVIVQVPTEIIRIESTSNNALAVYRDDVPTAIGAGNLDSGTFAIGKDYCIYLNDDNIIISLNKILPHRKIGGFHYGVNRRSNAALQPINAAGAVRGTDWEANTYNGILPRSVWTELHRPKCDPSGMVYLSGGVWVDIYISSDGGSERLQSVHGGLPVTSLNWYAFSERLMLTGKRLLTYNEWIQAALGSPQGLFGNTANAWSSGSDKAVAGFVERAVSSIGCRDCAGNVWEWLSDVIATGSGTDVWQNGSPGYGQAWTFGDFRTLIAGGSYFNGTWCGARTVSTLYPPWEGHSSFGARGACSSL